MEEEKRNKRTALINQLNNAFLNRKKRINLTKENEEIVIENNKSIYFKKQNEDKKSNKSELNNENNSNNTNYTDQPNNVYTKTKLDSEILEFYLTENDLRNWEVIIF